MHKGTQPGKLAAKLAGKIAHVKHQPVKSEDDWSVAMENELQDLTGQFNQLKQDSVRPVLQDVKEAAWNSMPSQNEAQAAENTDCLPQSVTRQILQPGKAAISIADRLQALRKGTHSMESEMHIVAAQVLLLNLLPKRSFL